MKNVKVNFALAMVVIIVVALTAGLCAAGAAKLGKLTNTTVETLDEERISDDEIDDVEGYGYILRYLGVGVSWLAELILWIVAVVAGIYAVLLFILAMTARLTFSPGRKRLLIYRILMGFEYGLQGILAVTMIDILVDDFSIVLFGIAAALILEMIFSARNTYSDRILE